MLYWKQLQCPIIPQCQLHLKDKSIYFWLKFIWNYSKTRLFKISAAQWKRLIVFFFFFVETLASPHLYFLSFKFFQGKTSFHAFQPYPHRNCWDLSAKISQMLIRWNKDLNGAEGRNKRKLCFHHIEWGARDLLNAGFAAMRDVAVTKLWVWVVDVDFASLFCHDLDGERGLDESDSCPCHLFYRLLPCDLYGIVFQD